jgi:hypothetical protein
MSTLEKDLKSSNFFDYTFISLFMFTYRKTHNRSFNSIIKVKLAILKNKLNLKQINIKTIGVLRKELTLALNNRFFPDSVITLDDPLDLSLILIQLAISFQLEFPEEFFSDIDTSQMVIADAIDTVNNQIVSFFDILASRDHPIYAYDINFILLLILEFLQIHLPSWENKFITLKEHIISDFFTTTFNMSYQYKQTPIESDSSPHQQHRIEKTHSATHPYIPGQILDLIDNNKSFILISEPFNLIRFGTTDKINPDFEIALRELFNFKSPSPMFKTFLLEIIELIIHDSTFRLAIKELMDEKKRNDSSFAHKVSA